MEEQGKNMRHGDRFTITSVRLSKGQTNVLNELAAMTGQTKTELIRESISAWLLPLYRKLKEEKEEGGSHNEPKVD